MSLPPDRSGDDHWCSLAWLARPIPPNFAERMDAIRARLTQLPVLDPRTPDEILGYDEQGLFR